MKTLTCNQFKTISPVDQSIFVERKYHSLKEIQKMILQAKQAQKSLGALSIAERAKICTKVLGYFKQHQQAIAKEITQQMGRPIAQTPGEIAGLIERAEVMIALADEHLAPCAMATESFQQRFIQREPLGTILVIAPWNYPYLTAINSIIPAIMAGNSVILKHASQTPLCAERLYHAFRQAGIPNGAFSYIHATHDDVEKVIQHPDINYVTFTGSVAAGYKIQEAAAKRFIPLTLELGGKDPAYVRKDAHIDDSVASLVDGAFFNAGQSCCGVERIYVHKNIFEKFVQQYVAQVAQYQLGNPLDPQTNLGPMVSASAKNLVLRQIQDAKDKGAKLWLDPQSFGNFKNAPCYLAPQVLTQVDHTMAIMQEETFGPAVGIMAVDDDQSAIALMNDSPFGLTASIWSQDTTIALKLGAQINTGTVFMNRCDYLDPYLAWSGRKNSGYGISLSHLSYGQLTRTKSYHLQSK